ncbi:hypothetical protein OROHE_015051 [Orobanche hederae]
MGDNARWSWVDFQHITVSRMESQRWLFSDADSTFCMAEGDGDCQCPTGGLHVNSGRNFDGGSEGIGLLTEVDHWVCVFYYKRGLLEHDSAFALICFIDHRPPKHEFLDDGLFIISCDNLPAKHHHVKRLCTPTTAGQLMDFIFAARMAKKYENDACNVFPGDQESEKLGSKLESMAVGF